MSLSRREAREAVFGLLFETEFKKEEDPKEIFSISCDDREIGQDDYIKNAYFGVCENLGTIDALINRHSNGWKTTRISRVSRSILRLSVYEMLFLPDDGHMNVSELRDMVTSINASEVAPADRLTDSVYHYDAEARIFELGESWEARAAEREADRGSVLDALKEKQQSIGDRPKAEHHKAKNQPEL